ncbi:hypothetical protein GGS23DRAFT_588515 [Durotheca rogersii]|uniref:uncharacterized protein n=1 Tax=Durotheca rogersii TaxID=419775 RepID=UPI00221EB737|nr:uncharacterized protein GGS23DRAFT_588515 [Durotheca rogersii]KAI5856763.1 hypothetical protein GGS23DRAFT_588515 [Durotheca rogersii]
MCSGQTYLFTSSSLILPSCSAAIFHGSESLKFVYFRRGRESPRQYINLYIQLCYSISASPSRLDTKTSTHIPWRYLRTRWQVVPRQELRLVNHDFNEELEESSHTRGSRRRYRKCG